MVETVSYKDPTRIKLIAELRRSSKENDTKLWLAVAEELGKVRRNRREVNVHRINRYTSDGDIIVVPGKVLGDGLINHKVEVAAFKFTEGAQKKIEGAGGKIMSISELAQKNPKGSKIKLMG